MMSHPPAQPVGPVGRRVGPHPPSDGGLLGYEPVLLGGGERRPPVQLVSGQKRLGEHIVHPGQQRGVVGRVGQAPVGNPPHRPVGFPHPSHGRLRLRVGPESGGGHIGGGAGQPSQRIILIPGMPGHARRHLRMGGLDQQRPDAAREGGHIADHRPGNRPGAAHSRIAPVTQRVGQGIVGVPEGAGGGGGHPPPQSVQRWDRQGRGHGFGL